MKWEMAYEGGHVAEIRVLSLGIKEVLFHLEKEMVTHSSILAWRIPWMEKPGRLQSTGLQRVGHFTYFTSSIYENGNVNYLLVMR